MRTRDQAHVATKVSGLAALERAGDQAQWACFEIGLSPAAAARLGKFGDDKPLDLASH